MKLKFAHAATVAALTAAVAFALPVAAQAYTTPPTGSVSSSTVIAGGAVTFGVPAESFEPGEPVSISVTGEGAAGAALGMVKFVQTQPLGVVTATADGSIEPVSIVFPATARGPQTILATSPSNGVGVSATVTATASGSGSGGTGGSGGTDGSGGSAGGSLPATGFNSGEMLGLWVGGGALLLAGGGLAAATAVRRNRKLAAQG